MQSIEDYVIRKLNQKFPTKTFVWEHYLDIDFSHHYQIIVDGNYTVSRGCLFDDLVKKYEEMGTDRFRAEYLLGLLIPMIVKVIEIKEQSEDNRNHPKYLV